MMFSTNYEFFTNIRIANKTLPFRQLMSSLKLYINITEIEESVNKNKTAGKLTSFSRHIKAFF